MSRPHRSDGVDLGPGEGAALLEQGDLGVGKRFQHARKRRWRTGVRDGSGALAVGRGQEGDATASPASAAASSRRRS